MTEIETHYREVEVPRVRVSIAEWQEEFPKLYRDEFRKKYLERELLAYFALYEAGCIELAKRDDGLTYWSERRLDELERHLHKLGREAKIVQGRLEGISPELVGRARQYPIANLVAVRQGMAKCTFHPDKTPSMDVRKNFYYCHGCQAHGDVIDLYMHLRGVSFKEAVNQLQ